MKPLRIPLRVVFYKEKTNWVAHCLEFDLVGHGRNKRNALEMLSQAIDIQLEASVKYKNPRNLFSFADEKYLAMFAAGKDCAVAKLEIRPVASVTIEDVDAREYSGSDADLAFA